MRAMTRSLAAAMVLVGVVVAAGSPPPAPRDPADGGTAAKRPRRATPKADAGTTTKVEVPRVPHERPGPTPGCPPDCYSSCGGGAARDPDSPPDERELR